MYFSTQIVRFPIANVDRATGVLFGVTITQLGPVRSHGGSIDLKFLQDLVQQANERPQGIKARFGHPNMCTTALGTYLGRFRNFRLVEDAKVIADLYLDDSAKIAPSGNLYEYILEMAERNPDMLGASIVFESDDFETVEVDGEQVDFFRLKNFRAADIVDDPAATESLFSTDTLAGQFSDLLDLNPDFTNWMLSHPSNIKEFLAKYLSSNQMKFKVDLVSGFRKAFGLDPIPADPSGAVTDSEDAASAAPDIPATTTVVDENIEPVPAPEPEPEPEPVPVPDPDPDPAPPVPPQPPADTPEESFSEMKKSFLETISILEQRIKFLEESLSEVRELNQVLNDRLAAKPTIPKDVTDPQVSVETNKEVDETGKNMLSQIPRDLRHKLKSKSKS